PRNPSRAKTLMRVIAAALVLSLCVAEALARAGGGQRFSGGGGSSGGGGGGGGGGDGGFIIWMLIRLIFAYPFIGIPLVILLIVGYIYVQKQGVNAYQGSVIRRADTQMEDGRISSGIATLQQRDPAFNPDAFVTRVRT